ncbi:MAG: HD domain-containing protein [Clostridia bacterium]|nr:HD domain-containing protein [Clostridia bacterium]
MKNENILKFYLLATSLKNKIRQGSIYWNVQGPRRESVAEHIYDTCILAIAIDSEYDLKIDLKRVLEMLIIHELEEIVIGDITPFDNVTEQEKLEIGKNAVLDILSSLTKKEDYIALTNEFNARETKEANFAHLCDKLDFDIQMKLYTDRGLISLDENYDSPVFKSGKIKEILANGAKTPSDVFYEYDVNKYKDSNEFKSLLDYSYSIDLYERLESCLKDIK